MHDVSNAINILDPSKSIDGKICKTSHGSWSALNNENGPDGSNGKCATSSSANSTTGLANFVSAANGGSAAPNFTDDIKLSVVPKTTIQISKDISALNRDQKGVVSSAFAKAHEGAEIVEIRSISTTSVM